MKRFVRLILSSVLFYSVFSSFISCSEEADCSMAERPMINCNLYTLNAEGLAVNDTLDSLTVTAFGTDSLIVNNQQDVSNIILPLRYTVDSTILVFRYSRYTMDTITIHHTNTPYFLSMDCGYQMQQFLTSVRYTRHRLDSIHVTNNEAGIYGRENMQLFY